MFQSVFQICYSRFCFSLLNTTFFYFSIFFSVCKYLSFTSSLSRSLLLPVLMCVLPLCLNFKPIWKRYRRNFPSPSIYVSCIVHHISNIWFTPESGHFCINFIQYNKKNCIRIMSKPCMWKIRKAQINVYFDFCRFFFYYACNRDVMVTTVKRCDILRNKDYILCLN